MQLEFITRMWASLDEEHHDIQTQILHVLLGKLTTVLSKLKGCQRRGLIIQDQALKLWE